MYMVYQPSFLFPTGREIQDHISIEANLWDLKLGEDVPVWAPLFNAKWNLASHEGSPRHDISLLHGFCPFTRVHSKNFPSGDGVHREALRWQLWPTRITPLALLASHNLEDLITNPDKATPTGMESGRSVAVSLYFVKEHIFL